MKITGKLVAESDPRQSHQWRFSPEATKKLAEDAIGRLVSVNYDLSCVVGRVVDAEYLGDRAINITFELAPDVDDQSMLSPFELGPLFTFDEEQDGIVRKATLFGVSIIPPTPTATDADEAQRNK